MEICATCGNDCCAHCARQAGHTAMVDRQSAIGD
jgi:hypothetical protein